MTVSPRHLILATVAVLVVGGLTAMATTGDDTVDGSSAAAADTSLATDTSAASSTSSSTSTTSSTTSTTSTTVPATTVPVTARPAAPTPPPPAPATGDCATWSTGSINDVRAGVGLGPLGTMGDAKACAWAHKLAANGSLSHDSADCGYQVVGYVGSSGGPVNANAPASIINNWFNSRPHYEVLTHTAVSKIALAFVTATFPDGSWRVYGVGNLCP